MIFSSYGKSSVEQFALHGIGLLDLLLHADIHLLPEAGNGTHTSRMHLLERLLYLLRIGVDDDLRTFRHTQDEPSALEDMRDGQEVHDAVVLSHRHALVVRLKGSMILSVGKDHTF